MVGIVVGYLEIFVKIAGVHGQFGKSLGNKFFRKLYSVHENTDLKLKITRYSTFFEVFQFKAYLFDSLLFLFGTLSKPKCQNLKGSHSYVW